MNFMRDFLNKFRNSQEAEEINSDETSVKIPDNIPALVTDPIRAQLIDQLFSEDIALPTKPYSPKLVTFDELNHIDGMSHPLMLISTSEGLVPYLYTGFNWSRRHCYSEYGKYHYIPDNPLLDGSLSLEESILKLDSASHWVYLWFNTTHIWNSNLFSEYWAHPIVRGSCTYRALEQYKPSKITYGLVVDYCTNKGIRFTDQVPVPCAVSVHLNEVQKIVTRAQDLGVNVPDSKIAKEFAALESYIKNSSVQLIRTSAIPQLPIAAVFDAFTGMLACTSLLCKKRIENYTLHELIKEMAFPRIKVEYNGKLHRIIPETFQWKGSTLIVTMDEYFNNRLFS